jgi:uncharacterized Fe-S cluster protein YjdI/CDGSH-type Zn-finger protein
MAREPRDVREYSTGEIVVEWQPRLCFHSHNCIRALPQVFDPDRRPWVDIEAASAGQIEAAVAQCPSGALRAKRPGAAGTRIEPFEVKASAGGPLLLSGGVRVLDAEGNVLYEGDKAALCRCGGSANKPFCDGTHRTNGFAG